MTEQRREERLEINREFADVSSFLREYALNISAGGVFIRTAEVLPLGTKVKLKFTIIVDDFETIEGEGEVVRAVEPEDSNTPGVGVVFTSLTPASQQVLTRLFTKSSTR